MKIEKVEAIPFRAPRKRPQEGTVYQAAFGQVAESEYALVFVTTDEGLTGIGEIATVWDRKGISQADDVNRLIAPLLIGKNPFRLNELCLLIHQALGKESNPAKAGVDIALHDLVGKALGIPVYQLLGGAVRESVALSYSISINTPPIMAKEASEISDLGFETLKIKVGLDHKSDLEALQTIRSQVASAIMLRADMNAALTSPKIAIRRLRDYEAFDLEFVEQPVKPHDLEGMAFVRENTPIPIMADESIWTSVDALAVIRCGAGDLANIYVMEAGGLREARQAFAVCEAAGMPAMIGSMPEFGIGTAAQLHLAVTVPNLIETNDLCGFLYHQEDILEEPLIVKNGRITPPKGPGLGVSVNLKRLERWRV